MKGRSMGRSQAEIGAACVAVFVVGSAFRDVYLGHIFQSVSVYLVLLVAFGIATVAGLGISRVKGESLGFLIRAPGDVLMMNLGTAGAWICYFLALKWLDPSIVNTLFAGIGPFAVIALNGCGLSIAAPQPATALQKVLQLGVVGTLCLLVCIAVIDQTGLAGGRPVLALSSLLLALGLAGLALAHSLATYLIAWLLVGIGMGAGLYDAAFATLGRLYGREARSAITILTLWGGFASTVCWPLSAYLVEHLGWRGTYMVYAAIQAFVCLPLHAFVLPGRGIVAEERKSGPKESGTPASTVLAGERRARAFLLLALILTLGSVTSSMVAVHLLTFL